MPRPTRSVGGACNLTAGTRERFVPVAFQQASSIISARIVIRPADSIKPTNARIHNLRGHGGISRVGIHFARTFLRPGPGRAGHLARHCTRLFRLRDVHHGRLLRLLYIKFKCSGVSHARCSRITETGENEGKGTTPLGRND